MSLKLFPLLRFRCRRRRRLRARPTISYHLSLNTRGTTDCTFRAERHVNALPDHRRSCLRSFPSPAWPPGVLACLVKGKWDSKASFLASSPPPFLYMLVIFAESIYLL